MFFHLSNIPPDPLPDTDNEDEAHEMLLTGAAPPADDARRERRWSSRKRNSTAYKILTTFFLTSAAYLGIGVGILLSRGREPALNAHGDKNALCIRHTSQYCT